MGILEMDFARSLGLTFFEVDLTLSCCEYDSHLSILILVWLWNFKDGGS